MSYLSDPDRLERFARYVMDQPMNVTPVELSAALGDAASRIRRRQEDDRARHGSGAEMIAGERRRQVEREGWTAEHDAEHDAMEMTHAAITYARAALSTDPTDPVTWRRLQLDGFPWMPQWFKPTKDPVRNLVKAGALIAAEIDRLTAAPSETEHFDQESAT